MIALLLLWMVVTPAVHPAHAQPRTLVLGCRDAVTVTSVVATHDGVMVGGSYTGTLTIGADALQSRGGTDAFLASFDHQLRLRWMRSYGGVGNDRVEVLGAIDRDEINSDVINSDVIVAMTMAANTSSITSYTIGDVTLGGRGNTDAVIARVSAAGSVVWVRNDGGPSYEIPSAVVELSDGSIGIAGVFGTASRFGSTEVESPSSNCAYLQTLDGTGNHQGVVISDVSNPRDHVSWTPVVSPDGQLFLVSMATSDYRIASTPIPLPPSTGTRVIAIGSELAVGLLPGCGQWAWSHDGSFAGVGIPDVCEPALVNTIMMGSVSQPQPQPVGTAEAESRITHLATDQHRIIMAGTASAFVAFRDASQPVRFEADAFVVHLDTDGWYQQGLQLQGAGVSWMALDGSVRGTAGAVAIDDELVISENGGEPLSTIRSECPAIVLISWQDGVTSVSEVSGGASSSTVSGEPWLAHLPIDVYTLEGRAVGQVTTASLNLLPVGMVLVLRQGHRVSLCYATSSEHISFSVPSAASR